MKSIIGVERFLEAADYELGRWPKSPTAAAHRPVITISRQAGSGAHVVAEALVAGLQAGDPQASPPWTMFDRDLVERVLKDHKLPERLAEFMPEDRVSGIADTIDELLGVHPSTWTLVRKTADTILRLAEIGNVVVIGRGGNVITDRLAYAFHVRLVGSVPRRIQHLQEYLHVDPVEAAEYLRYQRCRAEALRGEVLREGHRRPAPVSPRRQHRSSHVRGGGSTDPRGGARAPRPNRTRRCGPSGRRAGDLGTWPVGSGTAASRERACETRSDGIRGGSPATARIESEERRPRQMALAPPGGRVVFPRGLAILHPSPHDTTVARPIRGACVDGVHGRARIAVAQATFATIRPAPGIVASRYY